jgi:hypothetical protein
VVAQFDECSNVKFRAKKSRIRLALDGHQETLKIFLHCGRSTGTILHTGHSIGATNFSRLNAGNAAPSPNTAASPNCC